MNYARALLTTALWVSLAVPAIAQVPVTETWDDFAIVSSTMGATHGRLCLGADRGDLGCPTYAPSLTTAGDVSVTGNLSAVKFIGDGSELTGLNTSGDRITSGTSHVIVSNSAAVTVRTGGSDRLTITSAGNIGFGTTGPSYLLSLGGNTARTVGVERHTTANTAGSSLTLQAGGAASGATDKTGGNLIFSSGISTGAETSNIDFMVPMGFGSGTTDRVPTTLMSVRGPKTNTTIADRTIGYGVLVTPLSGRSALLVQPTNSYLASSDYNAAFGFVHPFDATDGSAAYKVFRIATGTETGAANTAATTLTDRFFVRKDGGAYFQSNVGIGTTSPAKTLDVSGTAQIVSRTLIGGTGTPSGTMHVSGTLFLAGDGGQSCGNSTIGIIRRNPVTGRLQVCK